MKITVYTVSDCQFSKAEKEYLKLHNLPFEEKNLEQNREWLTEMLAVSNNFAGTPVTKIEKNDGTIVVLKGFTKEEFDKEMGLTDQPNAQANTQANVTPSPSPSQTVSSQPNQSQQPAPMPDPNLPPPPQPNTTSAINQAITNQQEAPNPSPAPMPQQDTGSPTNQPAADQASVSPQPQPQAPIDRPVDQNPATDQRLNDILSNLEQKAQTNQSSPTSENPTPPPSDLPNIPDFSDKQ